jgi:hypothetical protein
MNCPEPSVTIAGMVRAASLIKTILRFIGGMRKY